MKDLSERCENLYIKMEGCLRSDLCRSWHKEWVDHIESFAREIRVEALEEAAKIAGDYFAESGWNDSYKNAGCSIENAILALAAKE